MAAEGLIGLTVAPELGGSGAGFVEALRVLSAVARGEPSTALILFMTYVYHAEATRVASWPPCLYERLARDAVAGRGLIGGLRANGRKSMVVGIAADHVVRQTIPHGRALLSRLQEWAVQPDFVYRHHWAEGDFVIWDNTGAMHRTLIAGSEAIE